MLSELEGRGWLMVDPPAVGDPASAVARFNGQPIKAGFRLETVEDTDSVMHTVHRSGKYDLEVKIDFEIGRGQVRVKRAEGYED